MAPPVVSHKQEKILTYPHILRLLIRPTPGRMHRTLAYCIACMISILIGEIWQLPATDLMPLFLLALWQADYHKNVIIGKTLLIQFALIPASLFIGAILSINNSFMMLFVNVAISFFFFFLTTASKLSSFANIIGIIYSYILINLDTIQVSDAITRTILFIWLAFIIAGLVSIAIGLLASQSPKQLLMSHISYRLRLSAKILRDPNNLLLKEEVEDTLKTSTGEMMGFVGLSMKEKIWKTEQLAILKKSALHSFAALSVAHAALRYPDLMEDKSDITETLCKVIDQMADYYAQEAYPEDISIPFIDHPILERLAQILRDFTTKSDEKLPPPPPSPGFWHPDAFTNPEYLIFCFKGAIAVLISIVTYKTLNWSGIHTCIITCFIVALPTMGEVIIKQKLRIDGAFISCMLAMAAIIFLMPHLTNIGQLLLLFGVVGFIGGWIQFGDKRISYIGLQFGIGFFLSDLSKYTPATDLTVPRDRIIGILIGLFISYLVYTYLWPVSANRNIGKQFQKISDLLHAQNEAQTPLLRIAMASKTQDAITAAENTVRNAAAEPYRFRPSSDAILRYRQGLECATSLMEDLLLPFSNPADPLSSDKRFDILKMTINS